MRMTRLKVFFRTFHQVSKCDTTSALCSSPWTLAAHDVPMAQEEEELESEEELDNDGEYMEFDGR